LGLALVQVSDGRLRERRRAIVIVSDRTAGKEEGGEGMYRTVRDQKLI
jgi:hypothetical protein